MLNVVVPPTELDELCQRHRIRKVWFFGSVLRPDFTITSDIDILVEFESDAHISYLDLAQIQMEFEQLFERQIDVGTWAMVHPYILPNLQATAQVIYERK
jgi:hypothetical protein